MRLFLQSGYGKVTVSDIAREATVAMPTVYASTGGKSAILATLIDEAMRDPVVDATLAAVRQCNTAEEAIRTLAHGVRVDNERYHNMIEVMKTAAATDDSATSILERSDRIYRKALGQAAARLRELDGVQPGLSNQQAVDILWFYLGHDAWHILTSERRWSWDTAEQWLADQATTALCCRA
jgi:AcrR family transcriptional regulator